MVNQNLFTPILDDKFEDNFHLTDRKLSKLSLKKWTIKQFNLYMRFAVFISISPLFSELQSVKRSFECGSLFSIIFEIVGSIIIVWRTFYIATLAFIPRSIEIKFVIRCIIVVCFGFFYFFIKCLILIFVPNESNINRLLGETETPIVTAIVYFIINIIISGIDLKILLFLKYYLNYNFDGYDCDDDDYLNQVCFLNKTPICSVDNIEKMVHKVNIV
jgi:hypothetical protein